MQKIGRKIGGICAVAALLTCLMMSMSLSVLAVDGYENHQFPLVSEPGTQRPEVSFYKDGAQQGADQMTWVEGVHGGQALSLNGSSEYLEYVGADRLRLESLSFTAWVKWRGTADASVPQNTFNQRLFTMYYDQNKYLTFTPYAQDYTATNLDGGVLDGMCMEYKRNEPDEDTLGVSYEIKAFDSATQGYTNFALPANEWHHIAVVADGKTLKLYVDGALHFEETLMITMLQLSPNMFWLGHGIWNNATLNAAVDEASLYDMALTQNQVNYIMNGGDPAGLTTVGTSTTSTTVYMPSRTAATEATVPSPGDTVNTVFELPVWGLWILLGVIGVVALLTLWLNIHALKHPQENTTGETPPDGTPPEGTPPDGTSLGGTLPRDEAPRHHGGKGDGTK